MSKNRLSDSLDLLLDTMCNTFGGVVFIAISLVLAFFVCQDQFSATDHQEKIKEYLQKEQRQEAGLLTEKILLKKKLNALKNLSVQYNKSKINISDEVVHLEQEKNELIRNIEALNVELALKKIQNSTLQADNQKKEKIIKEKYKAVANAKKLSQENQKFDLIIDDLREQLKKIPVTRMHFTYNMSVSSSPYIILLKNNYLYQLGANYFKSSAEVNVKKDNNILVLSPIKGTLLSSISATNLPNILNKFNKHESFLWIMVSPDSFESFVKFRRILRQAAYPVHWYVEHNAILYLGNKSSYSASY